jgi:hypothetical protein
VISLQKQEVEIDPDYNLNYRYIINAIGACSGRIGENGHSYSVSATHQVCSDPEAAIAKTLRLSCGTFSLTADHVPGRIPLRATLLSCASTDLMLISSVGGAAEACGFAFASANSLQAAIEKAGSDWQLRLS